MLTVSRDHPDYPWHHKPRDHTDAGLFVDGPLEAKAVTAQAASGKNRERAESPKAARERMRQRRQAVQKRERETRRWLAALSGKHIRNRRAA